MTQARVKSGVPAGGEFTATAHAEPTLELGLPIPIDGISSTAQQAALLDFVTRRGEKLPSLGLDIQVIMAANPPANPAAVFSAAVGTEKDPNSIPWPERPANSLVEVYVNDDDLNDVLRRSGYQGDEADAYSEVYASIDLLGDGDCDFYGITPDGKEELIALEVTDYEQAVEPLNHEGLRYRSGFANPMPEFLASRNETVAKRLAASEALLQESGTTVELEDLRRGYYRLKREGSPTLELRTGSWPHKIIETTNWREATGGHLAEFLGGDAGKDGEELFRRCATLVAQNLNNKAYADKRNS